MPNRDEAGTPPASGSQRRDFDAAVQRAARRDPRDTETAPEPPVPPAPAHVPAERGETLSAASLLHGLAPPAFATVDSTPAARGEVARAELAASLTGLLAPADSGGLQHWQFSFGPAAGPLAGVALTLPALPGQALQLQLRLPAHSRERATLAAGLETLRERLAARGAEHADISLHDDESV
ncbi:hypothetical protein CLD22_22320 [Rubrivivax gelatinosus]|nr:hypothetical protein [Rubrivivax gelatinosus]